MNKKKTYPTKKTLNLCKREKPPINVWQALLCVLAIIVIAGAFSRLAVINRLDELNKAEDSAAYAKLIKTKYEEALADYDDVLAEYEKYSVSWMNENEKALVLRESMIEVLNSEILPYANASSVSLSGNVISIQLKGINMLDASNILVNLNKRTDVSNVAIHNAVTENGETSVSIEITMQKEGGTL